MTRPRLQVILSPEEDHTLLELRTVSHVPQRTRDRAEVLRLSHRGWTTEQIGEYFDWRVETVREAIYRWRNQGLGGLWDCTPSRAGSQVARSRYGALRAIVAAGRSNPQCPTVSAAIAAGTADHVESKATPTDSEKKGYRWKRTRQSHRRLQDPLEKQPKQADLELLQQAAREGHLTLKYLDESGFDCWSPVSYSWSLIGTQKRQEQTSRHGRRVNIIGVWEPDCRFTYGLSVGSITSAIYIRFINEQAKQAQRLLKRTGKITVIVQDNAPIHTSRAVQQCITTWQSKGLYLFYLPRYSSELNLIEGEWHQIKAHQIRGRMLTMNMI